jgi:phosphatidylserine/phosphatidylglycerophosphate/cardiolipin synthase-like enzyme
MSDDYYLAEFLAQHLEDESTIAATRDAVSLLYSSERDVTGANLSAVLGEGVPEEVCVNVVNALENVAVISATEEAWIDRERLDRVTSCAELLTTREEPPENELVATIPEGETSIDQSDFSPLLLRLREIIQDAETDVFLVTPFFSSTIADRLINPLNSAAKRGVQINITTRYLTYGDRPYNRKFVRELYQHDAVQEATNLYEYVRDVDDLGGTVHAKMLLSDSSACYLGTANITHRGLRDNLELGVIFRDDSVAKFRDLADSLRRSSLMHQVEYVGGEFEPL